MWTFSTKLVLSSAIAILLCALPFSIDLRSPASTVHDNSNIGSIQLKFDSAQAVIGRPATPRSAAGVARRTTRRAVRRRY